MSRLADAFARCRAQQRAALLGYLTAYDPDREGSLARLRAACRAGLDVLELGVPFSDPTADGPAIQAAMVRALRAGASLAATLELAKLLRAEFPALPIVLFSYANPLVRRGPSLAGTLREAGIDAVLVVDVPPERAASLREPLRAAGLDWIGLVAPTTTTARRRRILANASGFVYAIGLTGVTGSALDATGEGLRTRLAELRAEADLPVVVGFGVREPEQVRALAGLAEGVVVGTALVEAGRQGLEALTERVSSLRAATQH